MSSNDAQAPKKILLDQNGNLIDEQGRLIQAPTRKPTTTNDSAAASISSSKSSSSSRKRKLHLYNEDDVLQQKRRDMHWDRELEKVGNRRTYNDRVALAATDDQSTAEPKMKRRRKRFHFHQKGSHVKRALKDRIREILKEEQRAATESLILEQSVADSTKDSHQSHSKASNLQQEHAALFLQAPSSSSASTGGSVAVNASASLAPSQKAKSVKSQTTLSELYLRNPEEYEFLSLQMQLGGFDVHSELCPGLHVRDFLTDTELEISPSGSNEESSTKQEEANSQALLGLLDKMFAQQNTNNPAAAAGREKSQESTTATEQHQINTSNSKELYEWWDIRLLDKKSKELNKELINHTLVEHPPIIEPLVKIPDSGPLPLYMTKEERKKLKRQTKMQRQKEMELKIRIGLMPPPPPKANLKTFMRVHLEAGTQDPTELERRIRAEIAQRIADHEARNRENKLSTEQKHEKIQQKAKNDEEKELVHSIFLVDELDHAQQQFKIKNQSQKLCITGCCLQCSEGPTNIIIAEGGATFSKKFQNVMLNKIKWNLSKNNVELTDTLDDEEKNQCHLLWHGTNRKKMFRSFFWKQFKQLSELRDFMCKQLGLKEYYECSMQKGNELPTQ